MPYLIAYSMIYPVWALVVAPVYKLWLRGVEGLENVPFEEPFIIAANHSSYYDALLLHFIIMPKINKKIHAFVNNSYWKIPIVKYILESGECIPVFLKKGSDSRKNNEIAFKRALNYLNKNEPVEIFPEGTRSHDGKLKKGYTGIAKLALKSKVPVLPVGIIDANKVLPVGKAFPRFVRCEVNIGKPIYFEKYHNKEINNKLLEEATRNIMKQIAKLIGQKYSY